MREFKKNILLFSIGILFSSCIGKNFKYLVSELKNDTSNSLSVVAESFAQVPFFDDNEGSVSQHQVFGDRPGYTIFLFSNSSCGSCMNEHIEISERLNGEKPEGFELFSFMTKLDSVTDKETLLKYREKWQITWPFAGDKNHFYHYKFCTGVKVPCTVIFDHKGNKIFSESKIIHIKDLEKVMKGVKIGTEPLPADDLGDNEYFGKFLKEDITFGKKDEFGDVQFFEKTFDEKLEKPLLLLLATNNCPACEDQHKALVDIYNSTDTTLKQIDILTMILPDEDTNFDATTVEGQERIENDWINKFSIPWTVSGIDASDIYKYFDQYCRPADEDEANFNPCSALFIPGKGIVMQRANVSEAKILSQIRKHLNPVHFEESLWVVKEIPEIAENAVFDQIEVSSESDDRPIVLIYGASFCGGCINEHQKLAELYNDPESFVHDVRLISLIRNYDMENEASRNSFAQEWKIGYGVPWEMAIIDTPRFNKTMDKYCKDPVVKKQGMPPCVSIFNPDYGKVFERASMHIENIEKAVKGELIAPGPGDDHH